jgi:regulator of protease activity HflC (stomatin/prohibitin superfamily)
MVALVFLDQVISNPPANDGSVLFLIISLIVLATYFIYSSVRIAPEHKRFVIFRLGKFSSVAGPGLVFIIPVIERFIPVDLREQVHTIMGESITIHNNESITFDLKMSYQIIDPAKSVLEVVDVGAALRQAILTILRTEVGKMTRADVVFAREQVGVDMKSKLMDIAHRWGVEVNSVDILQFTWE